VSGEGEARGADDRACGVSGPGGGSDEIRRGPFVLSTDRERLDVALIHRFLSATYWAPNVTEDVVRRSIAGSLCVGVYEDGRQIAFARAVTDHATFAWIADVFVLEPWRGRGVARWMVEALRAHPSLAGLRRWLLATRDAHHVYEGCGFRPLARPERFMEIVTFDQGGVGVENVPPPTERR